MLSRKNNDMVGVKAYVKEHDPIYCGLLKLASVSDQTAKLTSLTSLIRRGETDTDDKMEMRIRHDLHYIRHWSIWFDFKIVIFTVCRSFNGNNAF
jgi:lipopolysaccharide/colanic/teichoic acid biosynthesis glycosyltransferase